MARRNDSVTLAAVLTLAGGLIAVFAVYAAGRSPKNAALSFVWAGMVAVIVAALMDWTDSGKGEG